MGNITFYKQINLFLETKRPRKPSTCVHRFDAHVRRHKPMHITRVLETMKDRFFYNNVEVWNKSHIVWELFQTLIFSPYKAIRGTFPKEKLKILRENTIFIRNNESKRKFFTKNLQVNFLLIRTFSGLDPRVLKFTNC